MGALLTGVERVTYLINRCKIYELLYLREKVSAPKDSPQSLAIANLEDTLIALYAAILTFLSKAGSLYDQKFFASTVHGILNPKEVVNFLKECQILEKRVCNEPENCELIHCRRLRTDGSEIVQKLHQKLDDLESPIVRIDSLVCQLYRGMQASERLNILSWISSIPYEEHHYFARKGRTEDTGQWLLDYPKYYE